jgi:oligoribonuclease NrnB/cAMP/cGMP phosphodiesterase (DHH superfamily)
MKVFYHNDMDGKCAAHVINSYDDYPTPSSSFHAINYGMEFPFDNIEKDERIYILDYSIEPDEMKRLLSITEDVIWIDHHVTAIQRYEDFLWVDSGLGERTGTDLLGLRSTEMSGCCLAYSWVRTNRSPYQDMSKEIPLYIKLIGDRDTWTWAWGDTTKEFFAGIQAEDTFPRSPIWDKLRWDEDSHMLNKLTANGHVIQKYKDRVQKEYLKENCFEVEFHGYRCVAVCGRYSSEPFEALFPNAAMWLTFRYMPGGFWMVSLYSDKVDVSEIAKQYEYHGKKGGGHTGASGFECEYPPFLPKLTGG